jgi:hypothetical protein
MKNTIFCDVTPCGSVRTVFRSVLQLLVTDNVVHSSPILVTLMMIRSSETSILTRAPPRDIQADEIFHSHGRENLKSYIALAGWAL